MPNIFNPYFGNSGNPRTMPIQSPFGSGGEGLIPIPPGNINNPNWGIPTTNPQPPKIMPPTLPWGGGGGGSTSGYGSPGGAIGGVYPPGGGGGTARGGGSSGGYGTGTPQPPTTNPQPPTAAYQLPTNVARIANLMNPDLLRMLMMTLMGKGMVSGLGGVGSGGSNTSGGGGLSGAGGYGTPQPPHSGCF
jgi:hypothetical protein